MTTSTSTSTETDAFMTVHANAGNAAAGELPGRTYPALLNVRPFVLDDGTPAVVVTGTCKDTAVMGITCHDAIVLAERLRLLADGEARKGRTARVMGPADVAAQIPRMGVGLAEGRLVFRAGPTYVLDDGAARMLGAALLTSAVWFRDIAGA